MSQKRITRLIIVAVIVVAVVAGVGIYAASRGGGGDGQKSGLTSHGPIFIPGNSGFNAANGVVSGSGIENDPYIIENWVITAGGIGIGNTTAYFVVRNCVANGSEQFPYGICLSTVINGKIENNIVENYYDAGIWLNFASNNIISGNLVKNNNLGDSGGDGLLITRSDNNLIYNNNVENNGLHGLYFGNSSNNRIYHNNFVNNGIQGQEINDNINYWDNGYPSGGNYWSDYTGADNYRGETQDIPGGDGIGDTPYEIPGGNNQDQYPLMKSANLVAE